MSASAPRRMRAAIAAVLLIAVVGAVATLGRSHTQRLPGARAPSAVSGGQARQIGRLSHGTLRFALNLRLRSRALDEYLHHVDPGTGAHGRLTAAGFGARFGPSDAALARLRMLLGRLGIMVDRLYPQRTAMLARAKLTRLEQVFSLRFDRYRLPDGRRYFAPQAPPQIPAQLAPYITGLGDLSDRPVLAADIPATGLTPNVTAKAYDIAPLWNAGIRGQGQTIAIASAFGAINSADLRAFTQRAGIADAQPIEIRQIDGGSTYNPARGSDPEVGLDLQITLGIAPRAHIIDYQGSDGSHSSQRSLGHSLADIYNQVEQDGQARIVTTSYGLCEAALSEVNPGDQQLIDNSLKALEASSVTVFEATGDTGAYACLQALQIQPASNLPERFTGLSVQTPGSSPYAVAVGGTRLDLRSDGSYLVESAWSNPFERAGGGGGVSASEPRPSWQQGPGVVQPALNPRSTRQTPDVAGPSDPNTGFMVCGTDPGAAAPRCHGGQGGTSAAAPFWAASMALVQQYAASHGAGPRARCFAAPILYGLAARPQPVPPFHQIRFGNNGYYPATPGWNFATGLGSPDVFNLAQDYGNFLSSHNFKRCPF